MHFMLPDMILQEHGWCLLFAFHFTYFPHRVVHSQKRWKSNSTSAWRSLNCVLQHVKSLNCAGHCSFTSTLLAPSIRLPAYNTTVSLRFALQFILPFSRTCIKGTNLQFLSLNYHVLEKPQRATLPFSHTSFSCCLIQVSDRHIPFTLEGLLCSIFVVFFLFVCFFKTI